MLEAQPLTCDCEPGWPFLNQHQPTPSHTTASRGGIFFINFVNVDDANPTLSLAHVSQGWGILVPSTMAAPPLNIICNVNANPTPSHTTASWGGIFWTNYDSGADDEPCRLIAAAPTLGDTQRRRQAAEACRWFVCLCLHPRRQRQAT